MSTPERFVRRTTLNDDEYRKNFRQLDCDVIDVIKSTEARRVTRLMAALYLSLITAPKDYWERENVLRFTGAEDDDESHSTAWQQLVALLNCGNSTAKKAIDWMHKQGVIGYFAGNNGYGIRIFINRAASSIGKRESQKNLHLVRAPAPQIHTPQTGMASNKDTLEILDSSKSGAPKNGAEPKNCAPKIAPDAPPPAPPDPPPPIRQVAAPSEQKPVSVFQMAEIVRHLRREIEPCVAAAIANEQARTREWFEQKALPKAVRVAQKESYEVLKKYGFLSKIPPPSVEVGRWNPAEVSLGATRRKTLAEITELAESCVALWELQKKPIEKTLDEIRAGGKWIDHEDLARVGELARKLLSPEAAAEANPLTCPPDVSKSFAHGPELTARRE